MYVAVVLILIATFLLGLFALGFLVVNALSIVLVLFGVNVPAFGFLSYLASGFLLVYIRGYFRSESSVVKSFQEYLNKANKE